MNGLVVGIGDLHGHYPALQSILGSLRSRYPIFQASDPERLRRSVKLVFTGDYIDRGGDALGIISRLRRLGERNPGQIITLLGNHELMALEYYDDAVELLRRCRRTGTRGAMTEYEGNDHGGNCGIAFIREFGKATMPALQRCVDRMAPSGDIGSWMRALQPSYHTQIAGRKVLFMHADLHETSATGCISNAT